MRKFLDNLNNLNEFRGRHQTLKIHVQEKLHTHNFLRGAGVQESGKPPTAARPPGGGSGFFISAFPCWLFPGIFPTADKSRRTRTKTADTGRNPPENGGALAKSSEFHLKSIEIWALRAEILQNRAGTR
jgi:hypothetical protein